MLPDYSGGSLVNLVASIAGAFGARAGAAGFPQHAPLRALPVSELRAARNVLLVLADGIGDAYLRGHGAGGELARRRRGTFTSVFPSTTASAITTVYTGRSPLEHGLVGWFDYFPGAGCVAAPLPYRCRGEDALLSARGVTPAGLYGTEPLADALAARTIVVAPRAIVDSPYNLHHCGRAERRGFDSLAELVAETEAAVKSGSERKFVYAYWPDYDTASHRFGPASAEAAACFAAFDAAFGELLGRLAGTDTAVVATADHGFIEAPADDSLELQNAPGLQALLRFPLSGERRVAYCHVQPGRVDEFRARAGDWLGERGEVRASRELVDEGWFGPGAPHPRIADRIGDLALVMKNRYTIKDWVPGEARHLHVGVHGGTSEDEMSIPLVVSAC